MSKDELLEIIKVKDKEIERQDKIIREINKSKYDKLMEKDILFHLNNENTQLKQQLAEKEKEIADIKNSCDYYMNRANDLLIKNQDKISFAVEQFKKVKELILKECFEESGRGVVVRYYAIYHIFDNQIEELKKESNNETII